MAEDTQIIETLADGLKILDYFMEHLGTADTWTIGDLVTKLPDFSRGKITRIVNTLHACGYLDESGKRYRIGQKPLLLSHRRLQTLYDEHQKIKHEVNKLNINL